MAKNLRQKIPASSTLVIYDIDQDTCRRVSEELTPIGKTRIAKSVQDLTASCHTIVASLPNGKIARAVFQDPETGVIGAPADAQRLFIDCSTFEPEISEQIGKALLDAGCGTYADAPLAGGAYGAQQGTLSFMLGYAEPSEGDEVGRRIIETLSMIGDRKKIQCCGRLGMGSACKIAHNYVCLCYNLVATEGMALGIKYGIDKHLLWKVMTDGCANSYQMHLEQPVPGIVENAPSSHRFERAFAAALTLKDLRIAMAMGEKLGLDLTAGRTAITAFEKVDGDPRTKVRSPGT